ncbi:ribose ABC transporter ATP-binding protein RbsA, partial [Pantoea sp. SIMBA_133]
GLDGKYTGDIFISGKKVVIKNPSQAVQLGLGFITEDRKEEGLVLDFSLKDNIALPSLYSFAPKGLINEKSEMDFVELLIKRLTIKT